MTIRPSYCCYSRRSTDLPEPQGLFVLQTLLLAGPAIPIYLLARNYIKSTLVATSLVATYLLNPVLQQGNLNQFHPEAFQVLFISLAIYAAISVGKYYRGHGGALADGERGRGVTHHSFRRGVAARRDRWLGIIIVSGRCSGPWWLTG